MFLCALDYAGQVYTEAVLKTVPLQNSKVFKRPLIAFDIYVLSAGFCTNFVCYPRHSHFFVNSTMLHSPSRKQLVNQLV